ncbi:poly-gamma-glutamate system protein [Bremerella cremea]|uniref:poly-gamma-glutamate system protein n=1 Tax=Bremerella cremea TaxID=1031537 RepID=UPI0031EC4EDC
MKKIYWRPKTVSRTALMLIASVAVAGLAIVENVRVDRKTRYYEEKLIATEAASKGMETLYLARAELGYEVDPSLDPGRSGMIGLTNSPVTSMVGDLPSKLASANPNFAAIFVDMLKEVGVQEGDVVAVGISGSFPALNLCMLTALETVGAKPIVIASASSSQWGANIPELMWLDMERILNEEQILSTRSVAASMGGDNDRGLGLPENGIEIVRKAIERNKLPLIEARVKESTDQRMKLYRQYAGQKPIRAYINIGGGVVSTGRALGKQSFKTGVNLVPPPNIDQIDGVAPRFIQEGVPVIHIVNAALIAEENGLPVPPTSFPEVGVGPVFVVNDYNKALAAVLLVLIVGGLYGFIRSDIGFRLLRVASPKKTSGPPEPMV